MTEVSMPSDFLTRYSTTGHSCECPDKRWMPTNFPSNPNQPCKHITVFNDPQAWRHWMNPARPPDDSRFFNRLAELKFKKFQRIDPSQTVEKLLEWLNDGRGDNLVGSDLSIYCFHINHYITWCKGYLNIGRYNTTENSCECEAFKRSVIPGHPCKHIRAFRKRQPPKVELRVLKTDEPSAVKSVDEFNKQLLLLKEEQAAFEKEKEEYTDALGLCLLCYTNKKIGCCDTCNKGMCPDCWRNIELRRKTTCPWCRTQMKPLVDVLIKKFKELSA